MFFKHTGSSVEPVLSPQRGELAAVRAGQPQRWKAMLTKSLPESLPKSLLMRAASSFAVRAARGPRTYACALTAVAFGLSLMVLPAQAQQRTAEAAIGPFQALAGIWSGTGLITMKDGGHERIRCRGTYAVQSGGNNMQQQLLCASDSYKFETSTNITHSGGQLLGNWSENTRHVGGRVSGHASGNSIQARADGDTFTALLSVTTHGDRQTVSIQSPGSVLSEVLISLTRGSR